MEADGHSSACGYCKEYGHLENDCRWKKTERRLDLAICCLMGIFLVPLALFGAVAGAAWSALKKGFLVGADFWERWATMLKGSKGGGP